VAFKIEYSVFGHARHAIWIKMRWAIFSRANFARCFSKIDPGMLRLYQVTQRVLFGALSQRCSQLLIVTIEAQLDFAPPEVLAIPYFDPTSWR
jgi:hypothetical protein